MELKGKKIAFALTGGVYVFTRIIEEMESIISEEGKIIPIMSKEAYKEAKNFNIVEIIESLTSNKIIHTNKTAEKIEADILVIAPCSRKPHSKTCGFNI